MVANALLFLRVVPSSIRKQFTFDLVKETLEDNLQPSL